MKILKSLFFTLIVTVLTVNAIGQANPFIGVLPTNSGIVAVGATLDLEITIGNTGSATIAVSKLRPIIQVPISVTFLANALQTGLPTGWSILSNTGSQLRLCNSGDPIPGATNRVIILKVQGVTIAPPTSFVGNINFGNGTTCAAGPSVAGDNTADNSASSTIEVVAPTACSISVSTTVGTIACNGGSATLTATATGAVGAVEYSLNGSTFQSINTFTVNAAGSPYIVTVREVSTPTCTAISNSTIVTEPTEIILNASVTTPITNVGGNGSITAVGNGGTGAFTYVITTGTTINNTGLVSGIFSNLLSGSYTFTATDINGCTGSNTAPVLLVDFPPLPLKLIAFNATQLQCNPTLNWSTTSEINTYKFEIEKAYQENENRWNKIGEIDAFENNIVIKKYSFTDVSNTINAQNILYRLKMIDRDNRFTYSPILPVKIQCSSKQLLVYPNPANNGKVYINISGTALQANAILFTTNGKKVFATNLIAGNNIINVGTLANGLYILSIQFADGSSKKVKLMIQQ